MSKPRLSDEELAEIREIFSHYDADDSGFIDRAELGKLLDALGASMTGEELQAGLLALDENNNGKIEFDEFVDWWSDRT